MAAYEFDQERMTVICIDDEQIYDLNTEGIENHTTDDMFNFLALKFNQGEIDSDTYHILCIQVRLTIFFPMLS